MTFLLQILNYLMRTQKDVRLGFSFQIDNIVQYVLLRRIHTSNAQRFISLNAWLYLAYTVKMLQNNNHLEVYESATYDKLFLSYMQIFINRRRAYYSAAFLQYSHALSLLPAFHVENCQIKYMYRTKNYRKYIVSNDCSTIWQDRIVFVCKTIKQSPTGTWLLVFNCS